MVDDDRQADADYDRQMAAGMHHEVTLEVTYAAGYEETTTISLPGSSHDDEDIREALAGEGIINWREL